MLVMARLDPRDTSRGFAPWRVAIWLLLLLAGFGCVQYLIHAQLLWAQRAHVSGPDAGTLNRLLAWDAGYFVVAFVLIVLCAGCILRQAWARAPLRGACTVLALWMLAGGGITLGLKAVAVPLLIWLAWRLGTPLARAQFRRRH